MSFTAGLASQHLILDTLMEQLSALPASAQAAAVPRADS